jgi:hypothetical protein
MRLLSPLLRILPTISRFVAIPNLYYVQSRGNSRFEYRLDNMTLYIGPHRNLLFITNSSALFESRSELDYPAEAFSIIKPSSYDAALLISDKYVTDVLSEQHPSIEAILYNLEFASKVEAGLSVQQKKFEFRLAAPMSSRQGNLSRLIERRSQVPRVAERIPANTQYATTLSAGRLEELYQAALVFSPGLDDTIRQVDRSSRSVLGLSLNDLLFSWSGSEFAVLGIEGRPHPVYAIQIADERRRQEIFDRAFKSIALGENVRLNLDGMRLPRIEIPDFLQNLLQQWGLFLPSPYYTIYRDFLLASESAEALLSSLRAMQRNDVLPRTAGWRSIAGGKTVASSFSLYYSLDLSIPFFLRRNTTLSNFLTVYRQGLVLLSFEGGMIDLSVSLVPGVGGGVNLINGYPMVVGRNPSNRIYGAGSGDTGRIFFTSGGSSISLNTVDNSTRELADQGAHWIVPAEGVRGRGGVNAWVVTDRGRVTLVDADMEPLPGFPALTGLRLSAPPQAHDGRLFLCDEDGKVYTIDETARQGTWETSFTTALRSPPSFLAVSARGGATSFASVYPKSFFGEIWLLDTGGRALPNWPVPTSRISGLGDFGGSSGIGFGSPLLFSYNNRLHIAFVCQDGEFVVYGENASPVPPFPLMLGGVFYQQPIFDGEFLWLVSSDGTLFRVSLDGEILYQRIQGFAAMEEGYLTAFDSDGDRVPEIFITGEGNALHAYTRNFRSLEGFPLPVWGRPFFVPAQGGKKAEIFGMSMDRRLYRWQFR